MWNMSVLCQKPLLPGAFTICGDIFLDDVSLFLLRLKTVLNTINSKGKTPLIVKGKTPLIVKGKNQFSPIVFQGPFRQNCVDCSIIQ